MQTGEGQMATGDDSPNRKPTEKDRERFFAVYQQYGPYLTLGLQLAAAVVVFLLAGIWADAEAGTSPLFTLLGLLFGSIGGFLKFFRTVSQLEKNDRSPKQGGRE